MSPMTRIYISQGQSRFLVYPLPCSLFDCIARAWKALPLASTLRYRRSRRLLAPQVGPMPTNELWGTGRKALTTGYNDPDKVHEEVVTPEIIRLGPAICDAFVVMIKHAGCIVKDISVNLTKAHYGLERMSERVLEGDHQRDTERQRTPAKLYTALVQIQPRSRAPTAVTVSIHNTKGSEVRYRESDQAYSFQSWPKKSPLPAILAWLYEK